MMAVLVVSRGVSIRGIITAADFSAAQTDPQVHPVAANLQTFFTAWRWPMDGFRRLFRDMFAGVREVDRIARVHAVLRCLSLHMRTTRHASSGSAAARWGQPHGEGSRLLTSRCPFFGRSQGASCSSWPAAGARATLPHNRRTNRRTNRAREIEEGALLAEAPGLMVPTFRRRHFRLENSVRARRLFRRTQGLSAAARSISQAVVEPAVRLPAPANVSNLQTARVRRPVN